MNGTPRHPAAAPSSRHPAAAWWGIAAALAFIIYETTIPFDFRFTAAQLRAGLARSALDPFSPRGHLLSSPADVVGNLLLFAPLGLCLALSPGLTRAGRARPWLIALLAAAASATIEAAQLFSPRRYTQTADVLANAAGALIGSGLARAGGRALFDRAVDWVLRRLRDDPLAVLLAGLTAAILAGALLPLDLCIGRAFLANRWRTLELGPFAPGAPGPGRLAIWTGLLKLAWLFSFWGAAAAHWLAGRSRRPFLRVLVTGAALALAAEALQLFVVSRRIGPFDPLAGLCGVAIGATLALGGRRLGWSDRTLLAVFLAGYGCYLALDMLSPLDPPVVRALLQGELPPPRPLLFDPVPLRDAGAQPRMMILGDWTARLLRFVPLGALLRLGLRRAATRRAAAIAVVAAALALELIEGRIGARRGDMTDVLMASAGLLVGWFVAARLASRLRGAAAPEEVS